MASMKTRRRREKLLIGWREWIELPDGRGGSRRLPAAELPVDLHRAQALLHFGEQRAQHAAREAARVGSREVAGAIVASTLTTCVIFLPVVFARTTTGALFQALALVVVFALACSLLVALTLVPVAASSFLRLREGSRSRAGGFVHRLEGWYTGRLRAALDLAVAHGDWGAPLPAGRGRGISAHMMFGAYVAHIAEVTVDVETGQVTVDRLVMAVDGGVIVNPLTASGQVEGGMVQALGYAVSGPVMLLLNKRRSSLIAKKKQCE